MTGVNPTIRKKIKQNDEATKKLRQGIDLVADIIKQTLCPKGRNVIVRSPSYLQPRSMNDGHYIAQSIQHDDPTVNAGVDMVKQICANTNDRVGDGTTTTGILCQSLVNEGFKAIDGEYTSYINLTFFQKVKKFLGIKQGGRNPIDVKNEINSELNKALAHLKSISKPLKTMDDIENIATISGNNDPEIGKAIRAIKEKLGKHAPIVTENHDKTKIKTECIKGIYFQEGYGEAKAFVSDGQKKTAELVGGEEDKVMVLCYDEDMTDINEVQTFITNLAKAGAEKQINMSNTKILVICKSAAITSSPLAFFAQNNTLKLQEKQDKEGNPLGFRNIVLEAPRTVGYQPDIIDDIAMATKATVVGSRNGTRLRDVNPLEVLGTAEKVVVGRKHSIIVGGGGSRVIIDEHIKGLKAELKTERMKEKKMSLETRINMLGTGIGIIKAGGVTSVEAKERELRLEDAILATKAAIEEGIVVGGGNAYMQIAQNINSVILKESCFSVPNQILINSGIKEIGYDDIGKNYGFNALTGKHEDLIKAGVIDASKVIRVALENACSFASLLLTTSASIIEYEDEK